MTRGKYVRTAKHLEAISKGRKEMWAKRSKKEKAGIMSRISGLRWQKKKLSTVSVD